jgi:hypothetical protein
MTDVYVYYSLDNELKDSPFIVLDSRTYLGLCHMEMNGELTAACSNNISRPKTSSRYRNEESSASEKDCFQILSNLPIILFPTFGSESNVEWPYH